MQPQPRNPKQEQERLVEVRDGRPEETLFAAGSEGSRRYWLRYFAWQRLHACWTAVNRAVASFN